MRPCPTAKSCNKYKRAHNGSSRPASPGRAEYLATLDKAVQSTIAGEKSAADSLKEAAQQWSKITEKRGVESQRKAYRHCLGLER